MKRQPWFWPVKLFFKRISGKEMWLRPEVRYDLRKSDSWNYIPSLLQTDSVVYSIGVGDLVNFDLDLINDHGVTVHAFDPTPFAAEWVEKETLPDKFVFHSWAASGEDGTLRLYRRVNTRGKRSSMMWTADNSAGDASDSIDVPAYTVGTIMQKLEHERVDMLKMDVEGAEYDILDAMLAGGQLPKQLLVEYHHRFPGIGKHRTAASINALRAAGYRIFAISETGREVCFVLE
mgnify:FL=1